jgi:hypothetical protein
VGVLVVGILFLVGTIMEDAFGTTRTFLMSVLLLAAVMCLGGGVAFAQEGPNDPPCPNSVLAPFGLAPDNHCGESGCLLTFKNYQWWTAFTYTDWKRLPDFTAHARPTDDQEVEVVIANFEFNSTETNSSHGHRKK